MIRLACTVSIAMALVAGPVFAASVPQGALQGATILVAARPIARGTIITADDLRLEPTAGLIAGTLDAPEAALGKVARRALAAGVAIRATALAEPVRVRRGATVTVRSEGPGFTVEATAVARADGVVGAGVQARNAATGAAISGRVMHDGVISLTP